jgi:hypothetical protein
LKYITISALDLPICTWVEDHGPVHIDIIVILEIQEFFSGELSASVDDARVRDPEMKNDVLDKINGLLGANFNQGLHPDKLSKFIVPDE